MELVSIQFSPWDKIYYFHPNNLLLKIKDKVIVETELGKDLGEVVGISVLEKDSQELAGLDIENIKPVLRVAEETDFEKIPSKEEKEKVLNECKQIKDNYNLPMKIIDVHFSYDSSRLTFAFIADGRIDFRELVKDLTKNFGKTIRLQQIGIRDEAKIMGDVGHCGKEICCRGHLTELNSISSEMAELQQCSHRGSDRISGICGRLMCCLAYEQKGYEELADKMPAIGKTVSFDGNRGVIVSHNILNQSVRVNLFNEKGDETGTIINVSLNRNKK